MRLSVNKDKLEETLNRRRNPNKASHWVFPPRLVPMNSRFALGETVFQSLYMPLLLIFCIEGLHFMGVAGVCLHLHLHDHVPLRVIVAAFRTMPHKIMDGFYNPLLFSPVLFLINLCFSLSSRWAWNRRADRLSRDAAVPQAAPAALPGVWPPPPTRN